MRVGPSPSSPRGKRHQLGTDLQSCARRCVLVNLETDFGPFEDKIDHAARFDKVVRFTDGQHTSSFQALQDLGQFLLFGSADEKQVAVCRIGRGTKLLGHDGMSIDRLVADRPCQVVTEGIFAKNANHQGRSGRRKSRFRPFDESPEIIEERRLDLVLGRLGLLCMCKAPSQQPNQTQA